MIRSLLILFCLILAGAGQSAIAQVRPNPTPTPSPAAARPPATQAQPPAADVPVPPSKIALVDTSLFDDQQKGIFRYADAVKSVQNLFAGSNGELTNLQNRINALVEDIRRLRAAPNPDARAIQAKQEEGSRLQQDLNTKRQRFEEDYAKKLQEMTAPLQEQIGKALDQFARDRGITMTLDFSKLAPALLTALPAVDVTGAFIADFNRKNPRTGPAPK